MAAGAVSLQAQPSTFNFLTSALNPKQTHHGAGAVSTQAEP